MRQLLLFLFFICVYSLLPATSFYLDATGGSDANDGLTPTSAWQNLQRLRSPVIALSAGDTVRLKRGERWSQELYIDYASTEAFPVVFMDYGDPTDAMPVITSKGILPDSENPAKWTEISPGIWSLKLVRTPGRLSLDAAEVLRSSTLAGLGTNDNEGAFGKWFWNPADSTLLIAEVANPATTYSTIEGSVRFYSALVVFGANFIFENIDFRAGSGSSLAFIASSNLTVRNCRLGEDGNTGLLASGALSGGNYLPSNNLTVEDNVFDSGFTFFYGLGSERGCGDGLRLINDVSNSSVINNQFRNWAHSAVELRGDIAGAAGVNNNLIEGNRISAPDIPYAHPFTADGFAGKCQFNRYTRNTIDSCRTASQINGNNNTVDHNIVRTMRQSPSKEAPTAFAFTAAVYGTGLVSKDNNFDHNLIIDTDEAAFLVINYGYPETVTGHKFRNNICFNTGKAPYADVYPAGTGISMDEEGVSANTFHNNLFYSELAEAPVAYISSTGEALSLTAFNGRDGVNGDVISGNLAGDPLFTDLSARNYLPLPGSPAIEAGLDLGYATDFVLADRLQGLAPDIGPLETSLTLPVSFGDFRLLALEKRAVQLQWNTLSESGTDYFTVERAQDTGWLAIGRVTAAGNSPGNRDYTFVEENAPFGLLTYRLKQTDQDGSFTYSPLRQLKLEPAGPTLRWRSQRQADIVLPVHLAPEDLEVQFFTQDGRQLPLNASGTRLNFSPSLPAGVYVLLLNGRAIRIALL